MDERALSEAIEALLVARNPRRMQTARSALAGGYVQRAARLLWDAQGLVVLGTGFPVTDTFETDGPVGAISLYQSLEKLGKTCVIACGPPLSETLSRNFTVHQLAARDIAAAEAEADAALATLQPSVVLSIERPGLALDGRYYNMRGDDISERCYYFDPYLSRADCPTIGIGDGGNEIGMGNIGQALSALDIKPSVTGCDELLVADVSNWGAYGLIALLGLWSDRDLLAELAPLEILNYLSASGSVDGVTGANTLTEDGMGASEGLEIIQALRELTGFARSN